MTVKLEEVKGQAAGVYNFPTTLIFQSTYKNYYVGQLIKTLKNTAVYRTTHHELVVSFKGRVADPTFATQLQSQQKNACDKYNKWWCWTHENPEEAVATLIAEQEAIKAMRKAQDDKAAADRQADLQKAYAIFKPLWDNPVACWLDSESFEYKVLDIKSIRTENIIIGVGKEDSEWSGRRWVAFQAYRENKCSSFSSASGSYGDTKEEALSEVFLAMKYWSE